MADSESAVSNSPAPPASPPGGQEDEGQPGAFTPLTDSQGRELYTHELSYTPTLPEYPKTDADGFTYVICILIHHTEVTAELWRDIRGIQGDVDLVETDQSRRNAY
ncbi:hypothetical protein Egran_07027, partial [Elaphomyces granulatus]